MHFRGATSSSECQGERSVALSFERLQLLLQERSERLEVPGQFFRAVMAIEEIHDVLCPVRSSPPQVDGVEAEALDQLVDGLMVAVDEFTAPLAHHTVRPCGGIGVHA